jgi:hypothetical protein
MNHRPFEDWLLSSEPLSRAQATELRSHLASCEYCSALVEVDAALRGAQVAAPAPGFGARFEMRLQAQRARQRRRTLWGLFFLGLASAGVILVLSVRFLPAIGQPSLELITAYVPALISLLNSARATSTIVSVLLRITAGFVPGYAWVLAAALCGLLGWLWVLSISKFAPAPRA